MLWLGCAGVLAGLVLGGLEQFFWSLPVGVGLLLLTSRLAGGQGWGVRCLPCLLVVAFAGYGQWRAELAMAGSAFAPADEQQAVAVVKKVHRRGTPANPINGLFEVDHGGHRRVVEYEPDSELRDTEQIPLQEEGGIEGFLQREVLPYTPDAWFPRQGVKIGYGISFNRYFYKPEPMRTLEEIRADILTVEREAEGLVRDIVGGQYTARQ